MQRLHKIVSLPEIEYQPVLIKSSPNVEEVGRCLRTEEGESSKASKPQGLSEDHQTNTMVFRSNPLPDLKLLLTNRTDRRVTQSDDEVEIQVLPMNPYTSFQTKLWLQTKCDPFCPGC